MWNESSTIFQRKGLYDVSSSRNWSLILSFRSHCWTSCRTLVWLKQGNTPFTAKDAWDSSYKARFFSPFVRGKLCFEQLSNFQNSYLTISRWIQYVSFQLFKSTIVFNNNWTLSWILMYRGNLYYSKTEKLVILVSVADRKSSLVPLLLTLI